MTDDEGIRFVDEGDDNIRLGCQPKKEKLIEHGYKPKNDPVPTKPPGGKKGDGGTTSAKKE